MSALCHCGDLLDAHTLKQKHACRAALPAPSEAALEAVRTGRAGARKLDIPEPVRQGRQRAANAVRRGEEPDAKDVKARRIYMREQYKQSSDETKKKSNERHRMLRAERKKVEGRAAVVNTKVHKNYDGPVFKIYLCGANGGTGTANTAEVTCRRCLMLIALDESNGRKRKIKVHALKNGVTHCGMKNVDTTEIADDVTCGRCRQLMESPNVPGEVRALLYNRATTVLRTKYRDEFDAIYSDLLKEAVDV